MDRIFYTNINAVGVRRQRTKASTFRGRPDGRQVGCEGRATRDWAVLYDPAGTISKHARFGKMDLDGGVNEGAWAHGTIFEKLTTHKLFYFDGVLNKIRRLKDRVTELEISLQAADAV
jgi:hypothetical protein